MNDITIEPITIPPIIVESSDTPQETSISRPIIKPSNNQVQDISVEADARQLALNQCYLCAKKHVARAQAFFEEYHTGYPDYVKNLIESLQVSEKEVRQAFLLWQRVMAQLNMGEGELLGKNPSELPMSHTHISLANDIRRERLKLSDDPLYVPDFDRLLISIHMLQHNVIEEN